MKNYRWLVATLLFLATTINYVDRQIIGLLKPLLEKEFKWTETDFAHIVISFTAAYAFGLVFFGWLTDRIGSKRGYAVVIILWSIAGMLHALAGSVLGFILARIGLGFGEAGNYPAAVKSVAEWFPEKERASATGFFNSGASVGVVIALFIVPLILNYYGWQEVFWFTGAAGFIWLIFWWKLYTLPADQKRLTVKEHNYITGGHNASAAMPVPPPIKWKNLFLLPQTWAMITGKGLIDPVYWFFLFWLPSYFFSRFGLDLKKPSVALMVIYLAATVGSLAGGYLSSWLIRKGWHFLRARKTSLLLFAILEIPVIFVQFADRAWIAVSIISFAVAIHQAWATNVFTMASDMFPKEAVSSVAGIAGMAGAVGGMLFPVLIGYILDSYKATGNVAGGYHVIFTICGSTYLLACMIIHLLTRKPGKITIGMS